MDASLSTKLSHEFARCCACAPDVFGRSGPSSRIKYLCFERKRWRRIHAIVRRMKKIRKSLNDFRRLNIKSESFRIRSSGFLSIYHFKYFLLNSLHDLSLQLLLAFLVKPF